MRSDSSVSAPRATITAPFSGTAPTGGSRLTTSTPTPLVVGRAGGGGVRSTKSWFENSAYSRKTLKSRLYREGMKQRRCELCGQDEQWRGRRMALILDHINGDATDNRLENLQIVCPNCAATLDTHCGRNNAIPDPMPCGRCGELF